MGSRDRYSQTDVVPPAVGATTGSLQSVRRLLEQVQCIIILSEQTIIIYSKNSKLEFNFDGLRVDRHTARLYIVIDCQIFSFCGNLISALVGAFVMNLM